MYDMSVKLTVPQSNSSHECQLKFTVAKWKVNILPKSLR
jgi:hypothetical protein